MAAIWAPEKSIDSAIGYVHYLQLVIEMCELPILLLANQLYFLSPNEMAYID